MSVMLRTPVRPTEAIIGYSAESQRGTDNGERRTGLKSTSGQGRYRYLVTGRLFVGISLFAAMAMGQSTLNETVSVGYVMIPFTAIGAKGKPLTDLRSGEVRLLVDGTPVRSDMFEKSQNAPVSFTILLDGSG